jgi:glutamate dehydrogenase
MAELVAEGRLDRKVEGLPGPAALVELATQGKGLTRPELAVLLAYGKLELSAAITASKVLDDHYFFKTLKGYFPAALGEFEPQMQRHRLRREIIATGLANDIVNMADPTFPMRLQRAAGADTASLVKNFEAARRILRIDEAWAETGALDGKVPARAQLKLYQGLQTMLRRQTFWLARGEAHGHHNHRSVETLIKAYRPTADSLRALGLAALTPFERNGAEARVRELVRAGAPEPLAEKVAVLPSLMTVSNLAETAKATRWDVAAVARIFHCVGGVLAFDRLRAAAGTLASGDHYDRMAVRRLIEELLTEQLELARAVIDFSGGAQAGADAASAKSAVNAWVAMRREQVKAAKATIEEIEASSGGWTFAKLTIVNAALAALATGAR